MAKKHSDTPDPPEDPPTAMDIAAIAADLGGPADPARDARIAAHLALTGEKEVPAGGDKVPAGTKRPADSDPDCRGVKSASGTQDGEES